jgi:molecular chaperone DnaJ
MMPPERDYYETLGVARDADERTIKDAFRRLALRYHPDRSTEPDAEERFKQIAEAYAVLSDPQKRSVYDLRGAAGIAGFSPEDLFSAVDFEDLFGPWDLETGGLFDRLFGRRPRGPPRGADTRVVLNMPVECVLRGGEAPLVLRRPQPCTRCAGTGARPGTTPRSCEACGGSGNKVTTRQQARVTVRQVGTCPACGGAGRYIDHPCPTCNGEGRIDQEETLRITVPVGAEEGMILRIAGKGAPVSAPGGVPGDLLVIVHTDLPPHLERHGTSLWHAATVELVDAVLGGTLTVPTLMGMSNRRGRRQHPGRHPA